MFQTFDKQFFPLRDSVRVFPGHDYIENNLGFTLDREAGNKAAFELKDKFAKGLNAESFVSTIGLEREINVFFRLEKNEVRDGVASSLNLNPKDLDDEKTFIGLRRLRDNW
jgi:hydroxyacylglutathione hydrolase